MTKMDELSEISIEFILELNSECSFSKEHSPADWVINQLQSFSNFEGKIYRGMRFTKSQYESFKKNNKITNNDSFLLTSTNYLWCSFVLK